MWDREPYWLGLLSIQVILLHVFQMLISIGTDSKEVVVEQEAIVARGITQYYK